MCGIAGLMSLDGRPVERSLLAALGAALAHRGPDGEGFYGKDDVGFVHRRLAIIDLVTGDQPLFGENGLALIANGEIYNHVELRAALPGTRFSTGSDCEPPLALYAARGLEFTDELRGMYAIALHDPAQGRLVLARDPFGIKPLYYAETARGFAFASEPQALLAAGLVGRGLDPARRNQLLALQFTTGAETVFPGISRLLPGETLVVEKGRIVRRRRRPALPEGGPRPWAEDEAAAALDGILARSVLIHQRSDVPFGMFLSGGIDSSAILALMARLNARPVLAFTAFFPGTEVADESGHARRVAEAVGAQSVDVPVGEADFWETLPEIAAAIDDPAADYAVVPSYILARAARAHVKVILSGEGGDELFGGYGRYRKAMRPWPFGRAMRQSSALQGLGLLRDESWPRPDPGRPAGLSRLQRAQAEDCADWLPHDLLTKLDRCLMAHAIEGRVPFLDPEVARFAFRLPDGLKIRGRLGKWLLRRWLDGVLPAADAFSPKKGFTVPVQNWIAGRPDLGPLLAAQPQIAEICRPGAVESLAGAPGKKGGFALWTLLFYALWHRRHVQGLMPAGDVFATLSAGTRSL